MLTHRDHLDAICAVLERRLEAAPPVTARRLLRPQLRWVEQQLPDGAGIELAERLGARTVSRLVEICGDLLPLFGDDMRREFRADRGGADLAGSGSMIDALQVLKRSQGQPMPQQLQAFGINTGSEGGWMRLFMTHPPLDERIAALKS